VQGRPERTAELAELALAHSVEHEFAPGAAVATWALGVAELAAGRPEAAVTRLAPLAESGSGHYHSTPALAACGDLVEAAVRAGTPPPTALIELLSRFAADTGQPWARAVAARCAALTGPEEAADEHFRAAVAHHAHSVRAFDRARTELLYGEHLRRRRRRSEARPQLRAALETFERLGARSRGAASDRGDRPQAGPERGRPVDAAGAADRPDRAERRHQPGGGHPAVPQPTNRGLPLAEGLRETGTVEASRAEPDRPR